MDGAKVREWLRSQPGASESMPFGPEALVYKVGGKMFAVGSPDGDTVTLKCDPAAPLAAQVFKTRIDPFVQRLSFIRVYS